MACLLLAISVQTRRIAVFGCLDNIMVVRNEAAQVQRISTLPGPRIGSFVQGAPGKHCMLVQMNFKTWSLKFKIACLS